MLLRLKRGRAKGGESVWRLSCCFDCIEMVQRSVRMGLGIDGIICIVAFCALRVEGDSCAIRWALEERYL